MKHIQNSKSGGTKKNKNCGTHSFVLRCYMYCLFLGRVLIMYISRVQASSSVCRKFGHFHEVNGATSVPRARDSKAALQPLKCFFFPLIVFSQHMKTGSQEQMKSTVQFGRNTSAEMEWKDVCECYWSFLPLSVCNVCCPGWWLVLCAPGFWGSLEV